MRTLCSYLTPALLFMSISRIHCFSPPVPRQSGSHQRASSGAVYSSMNTSRRYAKTLDQPLPSGSEFEKRMRSLVEPPRKKVSPSKPHNIIDVKSLEDYKKVVGEEKDRMVVVRFHAPWCRACKAVAPAFYRMARDLADTVKFVEVPVEDNSVSILIKGLDIPTLPYGHIYDPQGGLVEELRMSRQHFPHFQDSLKSYLDGSCGTSDDVMSKLKP